METLEIVLAKNDSNPIYYQIAEQLKVAIKGGKFSPGMLLPSERELGMLLNVSRGTVGRAMKILVSEGYCYKEAGKGLIVSEKKIPINIVTPIGTTDFVKQYGHSLDSKILSKGIKDISQLDANIQIKLASYYNQYLVLKRIRYINNTPSFFEASYLPMDRYPFLDLEEFHGSLYEILREKYNTQPCFVRAEIQTRLANSTDSTLLDVPLSSALLIKEALVFTEDGDLMEFIISSYPSNRFIFVIDDTPDIKNKE